MRIFIKSVFCITLALSTASAADFEFAPQRDKVLNLAGGKTFKVGTERWLFSEIKGGGADGEVYYVDVTRGGKTFKFAAKVLLMRYAPQGDPRIGELSFIEVLKSRYGPADWPGNLVRIHGVYSYTRGDESGKLILMERATGSLEGFTQYSHKRLKPNVVRQQILDILIGMKVIHDLGWVHHDLAFFDFRASNVLVRKDGSLAIADFGQARIYEDLAERKAKILTENRILGRSLAGFYGHYAGDADLVVLGTLADSIEEGSLQTAIEQLSALEPSGALHAKSAEESGSKSTTVSSSGSIAKTNANRTISSEKPRALPKPPSLFESHPQARVLPRDPHPPGQTPEKMEGVPASGKDPSAESTRLLNRHRTIQPAPPNALPMTHQGGEFSSGSTPFGH